MTDEELAAEAARADAEAARAFARRLARAEDYRFDKAQGKYWDLVSGELYAAESVDASVPLDAWPTRVVATRGGGTRVVPVKPSGEIARIESGLMVDGSTWWPGRPRLIEDELVTSRGSARQPGALTINTYVPPDRGRLRHTATADRWVAHVRELFPDPIEHEHFFDYAAHMLQRPEEKTNHGVVMSGGFGIGKDTALLPLRHGVGLWNVAEISPDNAEDRFNGFVRSVMLVINEVRPHNEEHRASAFYNRMKPLLAAPPELLPMEMKQAHVVYVCNVLRCFLTTNDHLTMHIPAEDRRLFVMHSRLAPGWAREGYFEAMFGYFRNGGIDAVIHWLLCRDITHFRPGAPPPMTTGKEQIIAATRHVREDVISEAFEALCADAAAPPDVFFPSDLLEARGEGAPTFDDRGALEKALKAKNLHYRMADLGYVPVRNPDGKEWFWRRGEVKFRSRVAFVRKDLPPARAVAAVTAAGGDRLERKVAGAGS